MHRDDAQAIAISSVIFLIIILLIVTSMQIEHGVLIIGYSLAFGAVLAKMWRVYQVFHNPTPNKKVLITY